MADYPEQGGVESSRDYNKYPKLNPDHYPELTGESVKETSLEEEINILDHQTSALNDLMMEINKTRNRIYTKRMQNDEREAKLSQNLDKIFHGEPTDPVTERGRY